MTEPKKELPNFNIVRHIGDLKRIANLNGVIVERVDAIYHPDYGVVECLPYDNHFVYINPIQTDKQGNVMPAPKYLCTCGSEAIIVPPVPGYAKLACKFWMDDFMVTGIGVHQGGERRWV